MNRPSNESIESPCIGVCALDGLTCLGCGRSVDEIEAWAQASSSEKVAILQRIKMSLTR